MSRREKILAVLLVAAIVGAGVLFTFPAYLDKNQKIARLRSERENKELQILKTKKELAPLAQLRKLSLPANENFSWNAYSKYLNDLLKNAGVPVSSIKIISKKPEAPVRNTGQSGTVSKPSFIRLTYEVNAAPTLADIVTLLEGFYRDRSKMLHQIRTLHLTVPETERDNRRLNMKMTVEAIILSGAENRTTLMAKDVKEEPRVLARGREKYGDIPRRDIFFGPPPKPEITRKPEVKPPPAPESEDRFVYLTDITRNGKTTEAFFYDRGSNKEYAYVQNAPGGPILAFLHVRQPKAPRKSREQSKSESDTLPIPAKQILKIDARAILFRQKDKYYAIHVGQNLQDARSTPLKAEEVKEWGLTIAAAASNTAASGKSSRIWAEFADSNENTGCAAVIVSNARSETMYNNRRIRSQSRVFRSGT